MKLMQELKVMQILTKTQENRMEEGDADLSSEPHVLEIRVTASQHPKSTGHALRIVEFLVNR
mgnify:CR=1 FL=1